MSGVRQTRIQFQAALEAMPVAVSLASLGEQKILYMNRAFTQLTGYQLGDFNTVWDFIAASYPEACERELSTEQWNGYLQSPASGARSVPKSEIQMRCKDGSIKTVLRDVTLLPEAGFSLVTFVDLAATQLEQLSSRWRSELERERQLLCSMLLDYSQEMIVISPHDQSKQVVSSGVLRVTGLSQQEYLELDPAALIHPEDLSLYLEALQAVAAGGSAQQVRYRGLHKDGTHHWTEALLRNYRDPETQTVLGMVATMRDISDQHQHDEIMAAEQERLAQLVGVDELTGIANRRVFNHALKGEIRRQSRSPNPFALLLLDVDHFKGYNDRYGHLEGDLCLRKVAQALQATLHRTNDLVARFGGEEFVILLPLTDEQGAHNVARDMLEAIAALAIPYRESAHGIVSASIGVAYCSRARLLDEKRLLEQADRALYAAKLAGRNMYSFAHCYAEE